MRRQSLSRAPVCTISTWHADDRVKGLTNKVNWVTGWVCQMVALSKNNQLGEFINDFGMETCSTFYVYNI